MTAIYNNIKNNIFQEKHHVITNMSYHNLDTVVRNLDIFENREYVIIKLIKNNKKRGVYLCSNKFKEKKILKFIVKSSTTQKQLDIFNFFMYNEHPNFCKIDKILNVDLFLVLIMDYIEGCTLLEYFDNIQKNDSPKNACDISDSSTEYKSCNSNKIYYYQLLYDLVSSISYIHSHNIIHGDIKPDNIIINNTGTPIFIDYDLGKIITSVTNDETNNNSVILTKYTNSIFGTNFFIPPEMYQYGKYSIKTDIWTLGMSIFISIPEIRSQININDDNLQYSLISDIIQTREIKRKFGSLFANIINIMLIKDDEKRPCTAKILEFLRKSKYYSRINIL